MINFKEYLTEKFTPIKTVFTKKKSSTKWGWEEHIKMKHEDIDFNLYLTVQENTETLWFDFFQEHGDDPKLRDKPVPNVKQFLGKVMFIIADFMKRYKGKFNKMAAFPIDIKRKRIFIQMYKDLGVKNIKNKGELSFIGEV